MTEGTSAGGLDLSVLAAETDRLLDFGQGFPHPDGGAYWLDGTGKPDVDRPVFTYITARMAHVYALGAGLGRPADARLADEALRGLAGRLHDDEHDGWFAAIDPHGRIDDDKACYTHAFVVLAAASGSLARRSGRRPTPAGESVGLAGSILRAVVGAVRRCLGPIVHDAGSATAEPTPTCTPSRRSWRRPTPPATRRCSSRRWASPDASSSSPCRTSGVSQSTSHPTGSRCSNIIATSRIILSSRTARRSGTAWNGHACCCISRRLWSARAPDWLLPASIALFERAAADGWCVDGRPGFVYTTDWNGVPVVRDRMHWVTAEGVSAAAALHRRTGEPRFAELARTWWGFAEEYHVDRERGSWIHQLDAENRPADSVWPGKPDLYHAVQATLLPRYPLAPCLGAVLTRATAQQ